MTASTRSGRLQKTVRNMSWQFAYQILTLTLGVILPKYIIQVYGSDVNGLTSTIKHVLTLVTIVQAGLGTSATYLMYKPLEDNDRVRIANIIKSIKRIYSIISFIVAGLGLVVSVVLALTVQGEIAKKYIFIASFITCIDSSMSLFFTASCNLFLNAKQDKYIISIVSLITGTLNYVIQIVILILKPTFLFLYFDNMLICILNIIILTVIFRKQYEPYAPVDDEIGKVENISIPGVTYAALNEAAHSAVYGMITVVVSIMGNLKDASVLSVYLMVITKINFALVMVGPIFFYLVNTFYQHFVLPKLLPGFNNHHFWRHLTVAVIGIASSLITFYLVPLQTLSFVKWIIAAIMIAVVFGLILGLLLFLIDRESMMLTIRYFKKRFIKNK